MSDLQRKSLARLAELLDLPQDQVAHLTFGDVELIVWARTPERRAVEITPELRDALDRAFGRA